jgi:hypothetical protein
VGPTPSTFFLFLLQIRGEILCQIPPPLYTGAR